MATTQTASNQPKKVVTMLKTPAKATATAAPAKTPKAAKTNGEAGEQTGSRYKGRSTGMRVAEFQNHTLAQQPKRKLTDTELAASWREEFPMAVSFDERIVRLVRQAYNRGAHKNDRPEAPIAEYDENRKPLPIRTRGQRAEGADTASTKGAGKSTATAKATAKK